MAFHTMHVYRHHTHYQYGSDIELKKLVHVERMREIEEDDIEFSTEIFKNSLKAVKVKQYFTMP